MLKTTTKSKLKVYQRHTQLLFNKPAFLKLYQAGVGPANENSGKSKKTVPHILHFNCLESQHNLK